MSAIWDPNRPELDTGLVLVATPITSRHWQAAAHLANFLRGKGASLVPACMPNLYMEDGETKAFRFWTRTRSSAIQRVWLVGIRAGSRDVQVRAPHTTGALAEYTLTGDRRTMLVYVEDLSTKAIVDGEISLEVTVPEGGSFYVETISCYEQDRPILNLDATDLGVESASVAARQPIYDAANRSLGGIIDALEGADARRCSLFQYASGGTIDGFGGLTNSSLVYADLLPLAVPILGVKQYRSDTTARAVWRAYCKQAAGTGYVRLTTTNSGVDDTLPVNWSTDAWSLPRVLYVDCDDMAATDGRQGADWDSLQVEYAGDGTNAITFKSVSVYTGADVLDLFSGGTFDRESEGTYYYSSAEVSSSFVDFAAADTRRLDSREDGLGTTIILEAEGNTNHVVQSEDLTTGDWVGINSAKFNPAIGVSPYASADTCDIEFPAGGSTPATAPQAQIELTTIPNASVDCTISFWARMDSGTGKIQARLLRRDGTTYSGALPYEFDVTDTWQRFSTSQWAGNAGASPLKLCLLNGSDYAARNVQVWGVQVEDGISSTPIQNPSSYIRTDGGTAARASETLRYAPGEYPESFLTRGFAITHIPNESSADMLERLNGTGWTGVIAGIGSSNHYLRFYNNAGSLYVQAYSTPLVRVQAGPLTFSANQPLGIEVRPNEGTLRILGATTGDGTYGDTSILPAADVVTWVGTGTAGIATSGQADPYGGTDAWLLTDDNNAATEALRTTTGVTPGGPLNVSLRFKKDLAATTFVGVRFAVEASEVALNLVTGDAQVIAGTAISNVQVTEEDGWWLLTYDHSGEAAGNVAIRVHPARGTTYPTASNAAMGSCTVYGGSIRLGLPWSWPSGGNFAIGCRASGTTLGSNGRFGRYVISL